MEGYFAKAREVQAAGERKVDTLVKEVLSFACDLDVKRVNKLSAEEPGFSDFFWQRCGPAFQHVIDGAVKFRNENPTPMPAAPAQ